MKIKIKSAISYLLVTVLAFSAFAFTLFALVGCSVETDADSKTITYSNGGSVVEYGEYVFFINGIAGYPDSTTKDAVNESGKVYKGGLYRATKHEAVMRDGDRDLDQKIIDNYNEHNAIDLVSNKLDWFDLRNYTISETHAKDANNKDIPAYEPINNDYFEYQITNVVKNNPNRADSDNSATAIKPIANKIIGTGNYTGGVFIFDGRIYFASPANSLDKDGNYQYNMVDFFTCDIDGNNLTKLYSTTGSVDESVTDDEGNTTAEAARVSIPYGFFKQNGKVYLTTFEQWYANDADEQAGRLTGHLISIEIVNGVARKQTIIAKNILGAYFPVKETYIPGASINTIYDFVYTIREAENDQNSYGTVIEMMRPNGDDRDIIINNNKVAMIEGISGDFFYYRNTYSGASSLEYTNLYSQLVNSSYEKVIERGVQKIRTDNEGKPILKSGNTFVSEQTAIIEGYNAWIGPKPENDERETKYLNEYIKPMGETSSYVLINNLNDPSRTISKLFLLPYRSFGDNIVRVIGGTESGNSFYSISPNESYSIFNNANASFTPLQTDGNKLYGYSGENNTFAFINLKYPSSNSLSTFPGDYTSVSTGTPLQMDLLKIHDNNGNVVNTHVAFFTDYPGEKAKNYMVLLKVDGKSNAEGYGPVPIGYVLPSERKAITCYDPQCIDYTHDHTERDGYTPGVDPNAEEQPEGGEMMPPM